MSSEQLGKCGAICVLADVARWWSASNGRNQPRQGLKLGRKGRAYGFPEAPSGVEPSRAWRMAQSGISAYHTYLHVCDLQGCAGVVAYMVECGSFLGTGARVNRISACYKKINEHYFQHIYIIN